MVFQGGQDVYTIYGKELEIDVLDFSLLTSLASLSCLMHPCMNLRCMYLYLCAHVYTCVYACV